MNTLYAIVKPNEDLYFYYYSNSKKDCFNEYLEKYNNQEFQVWEYMSANGQIDVTDVEKNAKLFAKYDKDLIDYLTNN